MDPDEDMETLILARFICTVYAIQFFAHGVEGLLAQRVQRMILWWVGAVVILALGFLTTRALRHRAAT